MGLQRILIALVTAVGLPVAPASAVTIFSDDFNSITTSTLNAVPAGWVIEGAGTVDLIANGGFSIQCAGNTGGCIDLDGSTANAGRLRTATPITIMADVLYTLSADVSGNQRGGAADSLEFGLLVVDGLVEIVLGTVADLAAGAPFATYSGGFEDTQSFDAYIFFDAVGGDNVGPILDNVILVADEEPPPPVDVPEPAPLGLVLIGLATLVAVTRRPSRRRIPLH